jgi:hypothetical protein
MAIPVFIELFNVCNHRDMDARINGQLIALREALCKELKTDEVEVVSPLSIPFDVTRPLQAKITLPDAGKEADDTAFRTAYRVIKAWMKEAKLDRSREEEPLRAWKVVGQDVQVIPWHTEVKGKKVAHYSPRTNKPLPPRDDTRAADLHDG